MSDNKPAGQFPFPGAAIILLALGVFMFTDTPFQPSRPDVPASQTVKTRDVLARLWQDPFEAVQLHQINKHKESENTENHSINALRNTIGKQIQFDESKTIDLHILAIMVDGGPYAENRENRIRSRYAVTTGLLSVGYTPADAEHIKYLGFTEADNKYAKWPSIIPYEWFKPEELSDKWHDYGFSKNVLVLWIDENNIPDTTPLNMLAGLKSEISSNVASNSKNLRIKFDVIGPSSSTTLVKMYANLSAPPCNENDNECNNVIEMYGNDKTKIRVFSPRATLDKPAIADILENRDTGGIKTFPGLHSTIATDSMLVDNLLCELLRRGINPFYEKKYIADHPFIMEIPGKTNCINYSLNSLNKHDRKDYIVLIGEWDTTYTRNFNYLFRNKIQSHIDKSKLGHSLTWLYSFFYLRGLDGEIGNSSETAKKKVGKKADEKELRRPVGANQFDYLRRLAQQISELSRTNKNKGSIRAIGILGSDTYDKLLILQALRNQFPDVLFFTTDLDARMLHNKEKSWSRNLVVASAFDLTPKDTGILYKGLAFRDSYQTALYNTIQKATFECLPESEKSYKKCPKNIKHKPSSNKTLLPTSINEIYPPKIFEIGNNNAIDYSHKIICDKNDINSKKSYCRSVTDNKLNIDNSSLYLLLILGLLVLLSLQTNNRTRICLATASLLVFSVVIWLNLYTSPDNRELYNFFTGTSVWPAYLIRMTAFVVSLIFIAFSIINLKTNTIHLIKENKLSDKQCTSIIDRLRNKAEKSDRTPVLNILAALPKAFKWFIQYNCYNQSTIEKRKLIKPDLVSRLLITSWGWKDKSNTSITIDNLFYQYVELSRSRWWLIRVSTITALYGLISLLFIESFDHTYIAPFTGKISADNLSFLMNAVYIPYLFLIFFVSDTTRINLRFVELLSKYNITWPESTLIKCCHKYGLSKEIAIEKLKLDLIIVRSKVVDQLIFLPFIILTLMILSTSNYFDRWYTPPELGFVILLGACIALSSAIRLRKAARNARDYALKNLKDIYRQQLYKEVDPKQLNEEDCGVSGTKMSERLENLIKEIENISTGPFLPLTKHPIIAAVAMPFGGVGSLYLIEYMSSAGL